MTETEEEIIEEEKLAPLEVKIIEKEKEEPHPEWVYDAIEADNYIPTDEEIKEMTDAQ